MQQAAVVFQRQLAVDGKPVAALANAQPRLAGVRRAAQAQALACRPHATQLRLAHRLQLSQHVQGLINADAHPLADDGVVRAGGQCRALAQHGGVGAAFGVQVATGVHRLAVHRAHHRHHALAGAVVAPARQRAHAQLHAQAVAVGAQQRIQRGVGRQRRQLAGQVGEVAVNRQQRGQLADGVQQGRARRARHRQAMADQRHQPLELAIQPIQPPVFGLAVVQPLRAGVSQLWRRDFQPQHIALLAQHQRRLPQAKLDARVRRLGGKQRRVAHQRRQGVFVQGVAFAAVVIHLADLGAAQRGVVLRAQPVGQLAQQALPAQHTAGGPALGGAFLFARFQLDAAVAGFQPPGQPALDAGGGRLGGVGLGVQLRQRGMGGAQPRQKTAVAGLQPGQPVLPVRLRRAGRHVVQFFHQHGQQRP